MYSLSQPKPDQIHHFLAEQEQESLSYPHVGAGRDHPPLGYVFDHNRIQLDYGADILHKGIILTFEIKTPGV